MLSSSQEMHKRWNMCQLHKSLAFVCFKRLYTLNLDKKLQNTKEKFGNLHSLPNERLTHISLIPSWISGLRWQQQQ